MALGYASLPRAGPSPARGRSTTGELALNISARVALDRPRPAARTATGLLSTMYTATIYVYSVFVSGYRDNF